MKTILLLEKNNIALQAIADHFTNEDVIGMLNDLIRENKQMIQLMKANGKV